jgi:hypothetical protein
MAIFRLSTCSQKRPLQNRSLKIRLAAQNTGDLTLLAGYPCVNYRLECYASMNADPTSELVLEADERGLERAAGSGSV